MNFKAKVRLFMSQFKMPKAYYLQLEKMFENKDSGVYNFSDDGFIVATVKRQDVEQGIRASVRGNSIADNFPRGVAITEDGIKLMEGIASEAFINVMKTIQAFNKEFYARSYTKGRRDNSNWGKHRGDNSSDKGQSSPNRNRSTSGSASAKKGA